MGFGVTCAAFTEGEASGGPLDMCNPAPGCEFEDISKLRAAARELLVDGTGTAKEGAGLGILASVDTIDRSFKMTFNLPKVTLNPNGDVNDLLCNRTWTCAAQDIDVCPGQEV